VPGSTGDRGALDLWDQAWGPKPTGTNRKMKNIPFPALPNMKHLILKIYYPSFQICFEALVNSLLGVCRLESPFHAEGRRFQQGFHQSFLPETKAESRKTTILLHLFYSN